MINVMLSIKCCQFTYKCLSHIQPWALYYFQHLYDLLPVRPSEKDVADAVPMVTSGCRTIQLDKVAHLFLIK